MAADDSSLSTFLASALSTVPQRVIIPPMYDRANPLALDPIEASGSGEHSQAEAFRAAQDAQQGKRRARPLPKSGGPFKGFAFVLLPNKEDAERVLGEWAWEGGAPPREDEAAGDGAEEEAGDDDGDEGEEDAEMVEAHQQGKDDGAEKQDGAAKKSKPTCAMRARHGGMRALS